MPHRFLKIYNPPETEMKKFLFIDKICRDNVFYSYNKSGGGIIPKNHGFDYILNGKGYFIDSLGKKVHFKDNCIIVTPKSICYDYMPDKGSFFESIWVRFNGELADNLMRFFADEKSYVINLNNYLKLREMFLELHSVGKELTRNSSLKANGLLVSILTELKARVLDERGSEVMKTRGVIEAFYVYAGDNFNSPKLDIKPFLNAQKVGYESFRKSFKKVTGQYPYSYWLEMKFNKAKAMLVYSNRSISEIAYTLGYENLYAFSRAFKNSAGISPTEYRNTNTH